jgi:hypothetical protein
VHPLTAHGSLSAAFQMGFAKKQIYEYIWRWLVRLQKLYLVLTELFWVKKYDASFSPSFVIIRFFV